MTEYLNSLSGKFYGIKADEGDLQKLELFLKAEYENPEPHTIEEFFISGKAAAFLTVGETYFFREPAHFEFLENHLVKNEINEPRICSAAVSSGCEAYSIAILLEEISRKGNTLNGNSLSWHIDAFDLNQEYINNAKAGLYNSRSLREDGKNYHEIAYSHLEKTGDKWQIKDHLREKINFYVHNLMNELPQNNYDVIFFRNAFIYLIAGAREKILSNLSSSLKEKGILIMGVSETAGAHPPLMEEKNNNDVFYFQKMI